MLVFNGYYYMHCFFLSFFPQTSLELVILLPQPLECWGYEFATVSGYKCWSRELKSDSEHWNRWCPIRQLGLVMGGGELRWPVAVPDQIKVTKIWSYLFSSSVHRSVLNLGCHLSLKNLGPHCGCCVLLLKEPTLVWVLQRNKVCVCVCVCVCVRERERERERDLL
jgi:hypothetical protein